MQGGIHYEREVFVSKTEDCMVIRFAADTIFLHGSLGEGGRVFVTGEHFCVEGADEVFLYLTARTDFQDIRNGG